jgi:hypothetical protein
MAGSRGGTEEAALWRRWRSAAGWDGRPGAELDPLLLAAYAEGRLSRTAMETVEEWLARHPEGIQDVLAARLAARPELREAPAAAARAAALVSESDAQVLAFPRRISGWRAAIVYSGMAASLLVTSLVGFALGSDTYLTLAGNARPGVGQELLDPPSGLFYSSDEDPST